MPMFRKKPVVIEAELFDEDKKHTLSDKFRAAVCSCGLPGRPWHIHTLEGQMIVGDGDWIICGVKGEFYPCKPDIFSATYEAA